MKYKKLLKIAKSFSKVLLKSLKIFILSLCILHLIVFLDKVIVARYILKNVCLPTGLLIDIDYENCRDYRGLSFYINKFFCKIKPNRSYSTVPLHKGYYCVLDPLPKLTANNTTGTPLPEPTGLTATMQTLRNKAEKIFLNFMNVIHQIIINPLTGIVLGAWLIFKSKKMINKRLKYLGYGVAITLILAELITGGPSLLFWLMISIYEIFT